MRVKPTNVAGLVLVGIVLAIAVYVTFFGAEPGGLELDVDGRPSGSLEAGDDAPGDVQSLKALYRTINLVQKHYIDASRIDSRKMLVAAMRAIQTQVAEVLVREEGDDLVVRLGAEERRFALGDVATPWVLLQRAREVFAFLRGGVSAADVDFQDVEYTAINGMLQTLDPHSALLTPDVYRDMKDKTQGKFGGLGIVISIRDGVLTVISPIDGTPADLVGLKAGDQIVKIGEVSTVSMPLNDAVNLLRGKPGTTVRVFILRKGWEEPRAFDIVRAVIEVQSVESELLSGHVGYVRIKDFQGNTAGDLVKQLADLSERGARGLVLDLRNNPGGLLEAAIRVADVFLTSGVIVTTAGQGPAERDVSRARNDGGEPTFPLVVLVNSGSASASEIVAGALKNHRRALLVGQRTFGKGSVQVLYDYHDGSALKLTTAQYLTPGDISIQSVGVVPDVGLLPMRADADMLDLQVDMGYREADLEHHFVDDRAALVEIRPTHSLRYLWTPKPGREPQAAPGDAPPPVDDEPAEQLDQVDDKFEPDFEINLARDLVGEMLGMRERGLAEVDPAQLAAVLEQRDQAEQARLTKALRKLGVDWQAPSGDALPASVAVDARFVDAPSLTAGDQATIEVEVTNQGPGTLHRLLATSRSDFRALEDKELAFGRVAPGETVTRLLKFKVPRDSLSRTDDVLISFEEGGGREIGPVALRFEVTQLPRPRFAYALQLLDVEGGNGDGVLQPGESVTLLVDIENTGAGKALSTYATLKSLSDKDVFLTKGREEIGELPAGERRQARFEFEVRAGFIDPEARFELAVMDVDLRVYAIEKLGYGIAPPAAVRPASTVVAALPAGAAVRESPAANGRLVARLPAALAASVEAETDDYYRIALADQRSGWVAKAEVATDAGKTPEPSPAQLVINAPPALEVAGIAEVVRRSTQRLSVRATDEVFVRDAYVFVGEDKVFFVTNKNSDHPRELHFEVEVPLENGLNFITIVAEETADLDTREVITVRRDREDGMPYISARTVAGDPEPLGVQPENSGPSAAPER